MILSFWNRFPAHLIIEVNWVVALHKRNRACPSQPRVTSHACFFLTLHVIFICLFRLYRVISLWNKCSFATLAQFWKHTIMQQLSTKLQGRARNSGKRLRACARVARMVSLSLRESLQNTLPLHDHFIYMCRCALKIVACENSRPSSLPPWVGAKEDGYFCWLWRTRCITIVAILIQWDASKWQGISPDQAFCFPFSLYYLLCCTISLHAWLWLWLEKDD